MKEKVTYIKFHENKNYLKWTIVFFILWISCTGPIRYINFPDHPVIEIIIGSAPNFFAGITCVLWIIYATSTSGFNAFIVSIIILILGEFIQKFMEFQTFDWNDGIASLLGCVLGLYITKLIDANFEKKNT